MTRDAPQPERTRERSGQVPAGRSSRARRRPERSKTGRYDACLAAFATAIDGALPFQIIVALQALGAPMEAARDALGMSSSTFASKYGGAIVDHSRRLRDGVEVRVPARESGATGRLK